jgi:hypothetical protein
MRKAFSLILILLFVSLLCIPGTSGESNKVLVNMQIGNKTAYVNGLPVSLDVPPQIINGRTLVPIRFVSENLGAEVNWDGNTKTVTIKMDSIAYLNNKIATLEKEKSDLAKQNNVLQQRIIELEEQKGTLKIKVVDVKEKSVAGAEVWVWEKEKFGGNPQWAQATGQDGITLFDLPIGIYVVSLSPPKYYTSPEEVEKNVIYFEIKTKSEVIEKILKLPETFEQVDDAMRNEYLSDLGLGKLPQGGKLPYDVQQNINVFARGDQMCLYGTVKKEVQISSAIYDPNAKKFVTEKSGPPQPNPVGGFAGCSVLDISPGNYELKVYIGDVLVAVFPFEVR